MTEPTPEPKRLPALILVAGSIGNVLIAGTDYRVHEIVEHWEPTGVEGEPPTISTVIRFDPIEARDDEPTPVPDWLAELRKTEGIPP